MIGPRASSPPASQHSSGPNFHSILGSMSGWNGSFHPTSPPQLATIHCHPGHDPKSLPKPLCWGCPALGLHGLRFTLYDCLLNSIPCYITHGQHIRFLSLLVRAHTDTFPHVHTNSNAVAMFDSGISLTRTSISSLSSIETRTTGRDNCCW
jgi:hypothetical protein